MIWLIREDVPLDATICRIIWKRWTNIRYALPQMFDTLFKLTNLRKGVLLQLEGTVSFLRLLQFIEIWLDFMSIYTRNVVEFLHLWFRFSNVRDWPRILNNWSTSRLFSSLPSGFFGRLSRTCFSKTDHSFSLFANILTWSFETFFLKRSLLWNSILRWLSDRNEGIRLHTSFGRCCCTHLFSWPRANICILNFWASLTPEVGLVNLLFVFDWLLRAKDTPIIIFLMILIAWIQIMFYHE